MQKYTTFQGFDVQLRMVLNLVYTCMLVPAYLYGEIITRYIPYYYAKYKTCTLRAKYRGLKIVLTVDKILHCTQDSLARYSVQ